MKMGLAFGVCIVLLTIFAGDRGLPAVLQAKRELRQISGQIQTLRAENARLRSQVDGLKSDPAVIERAAREGLGFARADELVFVR